MVPYQDDLNDFDERAKESIAHMIRDMDGSPLLTRDELEAVFDKEYRKDLNIEGYEAPKLVQKRDMSLAELAKEAESRIRILAHKPAENVLRNEKTGKQRGDLTR